MSHILSRISFSLGRHNSHNTWSQFLFILTFLINEQQRARSLGKPGTSPDVAVQFAVVEAIKVAFGLGWYLWRRKSRTVNRRDVSLQLESRDDEEQPLNQANGFYEHDSEASHTRRHSTYAPRVRWFWSISAVVFLASIIVHSKYLLSGAELLYGPFAVNVALAASTALTLAILFSLSTWTVEPVQYQAVFTQIAGFLILQAAFTNTSLQSMFSSLLALTVSSAVAFTLLTFIYRTQHNISLELLHVLLFAVSLIIHLIVVAVPRASTEVAHPNFSFAAFLQAFAQAGMDITVLMAVSQMDAPTAGVLLSLGATIQFLVSSATMGIFLPYLAGSCTLVAVACITYLAYRREEEEERHFAIIMGQGLTFVGQMVGVAFLIVTGLFVAFSSEDVNNLQVSGVKPLTFAGLISDSLVTCRRKPLLSSAWYSQERKYHAFDDVLLIVFFSHARYDVNLDSYRNVYSEFFPNIVFVGPRTREDAGFNHSYDVLVDSYQADEDLRDSTNYKMAGRMAHHMLYTALDAYPCYNGYLWAPFDTLLNIPRLQQFDQNLFWYHSPFGTYVPNSALGDDVANANKSRHPPPANISPDPAVNWTETWTGWQTGWWWGDPHVGLEVCMRAFEKIPLEMRENMAALTNGTTRLIGGSADTLYIPGRHRQAFLETLGTFLETMCFLEIATPTAVHLVLPPGEKILFVDHWWIWMPPFNASFVRQKWSEGFEVDTFHTFHWGDKEEDGVWRGNPAHIPDVRHLLAESAYRQNVTLSEEGPPVYKDERL